MQQHRARPRPVTVRARDRNRLYDRAMSNSRVADTTDRTSVYGRHLMMRLDEIENSAALDCPDAIERYLSDLVTGIDMRILSGPHVSTEDGDPERYGHSGVVVLYESHAAVHTYPHRRAMFLDVFSCKEFDTDAVVRLTTEAFGSFQVVESTAVDRGHHWSGDAAGELLRWQANR